VSITHHEVLDAAIAQLQTLAAFLDDQLDDRRTPPGTLIAFLFGPSDYEP
jgi:hypothetical protein